MELKQDSFGLKCDNCRRTYEKEELQEYNIKGRLSRLCMGCRQLFRAYKIQKNIALGAPSVLNRTTTPDGSVVIAGKDVPEGYQDDPRVIQEKLRQIARDKEGETMVKVKRSDRWWASLRKMGKKYLKKIGFTDGQIKQLMGGGVNVR